MELPPRARRIQHGGVDSVAWTGTTSACAENTQAVTHPAQNIRNYLRVRGEYMRNIITYYNKTELPPRARRIQLFHLNIYQLIGTTSACAENTVTGNINNRWGGNYLRVRGEYPK